MELPTQGMLPSATSVGMHDPSPVIGRESVLCSYKISSTCIKPMDHLEATSADFAALRADGSVVVWGFSGGCSIEEQLGPIQWENTHKDFRKHEYPSS